MNRFTFFFILLIMPFTVAFAQKDRTKLEQDKKKIEEEIEYTNKLLDQTRQTRQNSLNEVVILNKKISQREQLINTISSEIGLVDGQMALTLDTIKLLENDLKSLKDEYAQMIYYAYKNQNLYDRMLFIFSAKDFNQAYQRLKYFEFYNQYRRQQALLIQVKQKRLEIKMEELAAIRTQKNNLLTGEERQRQQLTVEREEKNKSVKALSKKEKELQKTLKEKEAAAKKLQQAIQEIIAEEIRLANERASKYGAPLPKTGVYALTPEEKIISDNFQSNKGKLPWPVEQGIVSGTFGEHAHPVLKNVTTRNNGIDLLTQAGTEARAIFSGVVTRVMSVPNNNNVVIIRHGEFLSVYSNLDQVYVKIGEKVTTKQKIGTVFTNKEDSKTELHFEVWQSKTLQNPVEWLAK
ncbi:MAG TPA: peptidoglycan DD-metalloendopeptidase family protein [Bacteroidales bacterium]|nr:peptidoglycan DD-metalloendopeptidase family protein [Bacteroidales bacterium]HNQ82815.1 peptidoglycan DD-metalloendopeptidase family protein [Bacteroidales bacterium]HOX77246.1 peptidoglycan DD-metalloendopeptidase family protein [Bacteroidales bacterium]HPI86066.1 peptidoglycan DD-metalloendopeptidase family protein [Bacteroidales bacterium]HPM91447.1 peptidoglycan DD-metalloendopeptidase family protein [Bacteroidales bacterium]